MNRADIRALISLHDVMPETFPDVVDVLHRLEGYGIPPITLLVVPGKPWRQDHLDYLKEWVGMGYTLAAHGWNHEVKSIRGIYHRLHSLLLSRNVAEHLEWPANEVYTNIQRSLAWFSKNDLPVPEFYVPPAWALGRIRFPVKQSIEAAEAPFPRHVEVLSGIIETRTGTLRRLPLIGFEADTWFRQQFVRYWNRVQLARGQSTGRPVRIGLHPFDFDLRLSEDLQALFSSPHLTPIDLSTWLENL